MQSGAAVWIHLVRWGGAGLGHKINMSNLMKNWDNATTTSITNSSLLTQIVTAFNTSSFFPHLPNYLYQRGYVVICCSTLQQASAAGEDAMMSSLGLNILLKDTETFGPPNHQLGSAGGASDGSRYFVSFLLQYKFHLETWQHFCPRLR